MKALKKNDLGVSPVIAVILMVAITVVLAGVVFLWAQSFTDDTGGGVETLNIQAEVTWTDTDDSDTASATDVISINFETMGGSVEWSDYEVKVSDGTNTESIDTSGEATSNAGDTTSFTITLPDPPVFSVKTGDNVNIKIINIGENQVVWENDLRVTNA